ncbi:GGDEF domain-containing protein, partial [bacterium]|nr:GGDEF domain-containing protein [bacterium]
DEFVVFFPSTSLEGVQIVTLRLLEAIRKNYLSISGEKVRISVSMGLAIYPTNARNKEALFRKADRALYRAKLKGRDQACFYSESLDKN